VAPKPRSVATGGVKVKQIATINADGEMTKDQLAEVLNRVQAELEAKLNPVLKANILNGVLVPAFALPAGTPVDINHGLGRAPQGWILVRNYASAIVWENPVSARDAVNILRLNSSADTTVALWVF